MTSFKPRARSRTGGRPPERDRPARRRPKEDAAARARRPLREDLVTQAALEAYAAVRQEGRLADRALDFTLRHKKNLYSTERRAVAERVYQLLRRQRLVDELLDRSRKGFESLSTSRKDLLRLSAARILSGEKLATVLASPSLPAEDRPVLEHLEQARAQLKSLPEAQAFAIEASLPDFLAVRFLKELQPDPWKAAAAMNERAPLTARVNTLKTSREALINRLANEGMAVRPTPLSPLGIFLDDRVNAFSLTAFKEGWFEIQDEGSQILGQLVDPMPTCVIDCCAGAGGKTLQLAAEMKNKGDLYALDIDEKRLGELKLRARRAGVHNVRIRTIPPDSNDGLGDLLGKADRVLVDAPCSGTGTLRRKPDGRYRMAESDLTIFAARQASLLERFSALVKPGGWLIYGTCSVLGEENETVVRAFLHNHPDFSVKPITERLGPELGPKVERDGFLRLYPHQHGTDGFFGAILVRSKTAAAQKTLAPGVPSPRT